jgi:4-amino-4-deoxy-L-arabinose transferase-like glycosyltransferase
MSSFGYKDNNKVILLENIFINLYRMRRWLITVINRKHLISHTIILWLFIFILVLPAMLAQPRSHTIDEPSYMTTGFNIAFGRGFVDPFGEIKSTHPPLFPLFLAFVFKLFSFSIENATIVARFFTWFNVLMIYYLGSSLVDRRVGLISALIAASVPYTNDYATRILRDNVQSAFMLLSLLFYVRVLKTDKPIYYYLTGVALGLGILAKETSFLWLPLPIIGTFLFRKGWNGIVGSIKYCIGFGLTVIWWWLYYYVQTGQIYLHIVRVGILLSFWVHQLFS